MRRGSRSIQCRCISYCRSGTHFKQFTGSPGIIFQINKDPEDSIKTVSVKIPFNELKSINLFPWKLQTWQFSDSPGGCLA